MQFVGMQVGQGLTGYAARGVIPDQRSSERLSVRASERAYAIPEYLAYKGEITSSGRTSDVSGKRTRSGLCRAKRDGDASPLSAEQAG